MAGVGERVGDDRMQLRLKVMLSALIVACAAAIVDQGSKWLILNVVMDPPRVIPVLPFFALRLGFNTGISFGLFGESFAAAPNLLAGLTIAIIAGLFVGACFSKSLLEAGAFGLVLGGAVGNVADRLRIGAVVDFLDFHYAGWHWPTFNAADIFITTGVGLLVFSSFLPRRPAVAGRSIT